MPRAVGATLHEQSRIGLLATLPGETLGKLAEGMRREEIAPGAAVVNEGEDGDRFYVVLSGMLAVSQASRGPHGVGARADSGHRGQLRPRDVRQVRAAALRR